MLTFNLHSILKDSFWQVSHFYLLIKCPTLAPQMELSNHSDLLAIKWIEQASRALVGAAAAVSLSLWIVLLFNQPQHEMREEKLPVLSMNVLGQGPLSLSTLPLGEMDPIFQELVLIGTSTRPDQDHDHACTIALRSSGEKRTISIGETLFFELKEGHLFFSNEATDLSMTARTHEKRELICEIRNKDASHPYALSSSAIFSQSLDQEPYVELLKKGSAWGKDVFLTDWGGDEYREMTNKVKISLGPDVYFLKPGDCLWWDGDVWRTEVESDEIRPIAQLTKASSHGADFEVWDSTGFSSQTVRLSMESLPKTSLKIDELMTAIRPRSATEITCQLGKRRVILREGDWWIHADNRWRPVRTAADLEACLNHEIQGELFIFEKVEASNGNVTLKGQAFDRMRTSCQPVSLVMQTEKKKTINHKPSTGTPLIAKSKNYSKQRHLIPSQNSGKSEDL